MLLVQILLPRLLLQTDAVRLLPEDVLRWLRSDTALRELQVAGGKTVLREAVKTFLPRGHEEHEGNLQIKPWFASCTLCLCGEIEFSSVA